MRSLILSLTLSAAVLGIVSAAPSSAAAQNPMFMATANRFGLFSNVNIFAPPIVRLNVNPQGPNFGFNLQAMFFPSLRARFSPFGQRVLFISNSSSSFSFNPSTGPRSVVNTPAFMMFSFTPSTGFQQFMLPSQTIVSTLAGTVAVPNPMTPTFLGNFNSGIPVFTSNGLIFLPTAPLAGMVAQPFKPTISTGLTSTTGMTAAGSTGGLTIIRPNGVTTFVLPNGTMVPMPTFKGGAMARSNSMASPSAIRGPAAYSYIPADLIIK